MPNETETANVRNETDSANARYGMDLDEKQTENFRVFTRHCPACESGMEAPGIRHSKKCNARQSANAELSVPVDPADTVSDESKKEAVLVVRPADDDFEMTVDSEAVLNRPDLKRTSDVPVDRLEEEMKDFVDSAGDSSGVDSAGNDGIGATLSSLVVYAFQLSSYVPLLSCLIDSVQFDNTATSVIIPFGDWKIRIWEPVSAIDDTTLQELPGDQTLQGMLKEMSNLNEKQTGDLYLFEDLEDLKTKIRV